ncbi:ABC transporter permease [Cellulomonas sp. S1-8]|uniref:ABC transporter permease n=1 Tax=Cellulomonas sp. S1-8 TaxID=2904790 RepID=UPI002242DA54|nr:ABC-2 family transporter protein [Cellulomonas sp. S1-8]UZN03268.1 ABC-2 family transporter protein [Cellulomonas sp. S1-8]
MTRPAVADQLPALAHVVRLRFATAYAYRASMLWLLGITVTQVFVLRQVWEALFRSRADVLPLSLDEVLVSITLANLIVWCFPTQTVSGWVRERVREGSVVFDLVRPVGYVPQLGAHLVGACASASAMVVLALPLVALVGRLTPPAGWDAGLLFVVSLLLGLTVAGLLAALLALVAFWTTEVNGMAMLYSLVASFFSGVFVPVEAFPDALRTLALLTPFPATAAVPISLYLGRVEGTDALAALGLQLLWIVVLGATASFVWRRARRRVVVQGG